MTWLAWLILVILEVRSELLSTNYFILCLICNSIKCFYYNYILFKKWLTLSICKINSKIKNVCFTKFRRSYKITLQLIKYGIRKAPTRKISTHQTPPGKFPPYKFPPGLFPPMFLNIRTRVFKSCIKKIVACRSKFDNRSLL